MICEQCHQRPAVFAVSGRVLCLKCQSDVLFEEAVRRVGWHVRESITASLKQAFAMRRAKKQFESETQKDEPASEAKPREGKKNPL